MKMLTIYIDNKPYQVKEGQNLLQACLSLGFDLPYFCWHPAMHAVGACRQCAVKQFRDERDTRGRIVMSCMTPAADGLRISVDDPEAKAFRSSVIEWLMLNHPHDCPICDEGGECHLQDMTVMTGHNYRRTRFKKRTHRNQYLGPFVNHEMNRCIQCYRCVRFYRDYAGGRDLDVFGAHHHVYFGRHEEGVLESEFSGNLVEVCPTGVFTDKTLKRHYTRKWDLQTAPSVCVHCGLGCNTIPGERYGTLRRILNRYNHEVNGYFLCDRGRYGYEFVNSDKRIGQPLISPSLNPSHQGREKSSSALSPRGRGLGEEGSQAQPVTKETALKHIADILSRSQGIIGIGSPRASLESNFALRTLVGPERFYSGMSENESRLVSLIIGILRDGPARSPSLHDVEQADAVLVLGEDVTNEAPMLALALRQSVRRKPMEIAKRLHIPEWDDAAVREAMQHEKGPLFIATSAGTRLDDVATKTYHSSPDDIARLGFAVAHELNPGAPAVPGISDAIHPTPVLPRQLPRPLGERVGVRGDASELLSLARQIAQALKNAKRPLVISGTGCGSEAVIQAAANAAWALCGNGRTAELCFVMPECNSMGLGLMEGKSLNEILKTPSPLAGEGRGEEGIKADTVIILENDLHRRADEEAVDEFLSRAKHVIVIDHLLNTTLAKAEVVLPAGTFAESNGTFVNNEGRAQRAYQVFVPRFFSPEDAVQESRQWINDIIESIGSHGSQESKELTSSTRQTLQTPDSLDSAIVEELPVFKPILDIAPAADFRIQGAKIPRQPHRYSGRTAMLADVNVHEPQQPDDADSPLAFSMEGYEGRPPSALISRYWAPGWNSVQALNKFQQEVGGPLRGGDPGKRLIEPAQTFTLPSSLPSREGQHLPRPDSNGSSPLAGEDKGGGEKGVRGVTGANIVFFKNIPEAFKPRESEWLLVPLYHIFGSEELSVLSPGIAERAPKPYIALNPANTAKLGVVAEREEITLTVAGKELRLPVKLMPALPVGIAGLPAGLRELPGIYFPVWGKLSRVS